MPTERKTNIVAELKETLAKSSSGVIADYRGMATPELTNLRGKLRTAGCELRVVKNTLVAMAAKESGKDSLASIFAGPSAIAFGYADAAAPAKVMTDYVRSTRDTQLKIKGGFLGDKPITTAQVTTLAVLPPRPVLLSMVAGGIKAPIASLVSHLMVPLAGLSGLLEARRKQLETGSATK
ncbi:MAG: 50S ribosomal protein L10 [Chloroflexota bacterium]